jgi:hypothetical protein
VPWLESASWQIYDSNAAFLFEVPERSSPLVVQELQIGGTGLDSFDSWDKVAMLAKNLKKPPGGSNARHHA